MTQTADEHDFNPFDSDAEQPVDLVWPSRLLVPDGPPLLAYLDLNHWVGLSKAAVGHPNGTRYVPALEAARSTRASGKVIFPLSGTHYQEVAKMADEHRRKDLAVVMEELSGFTTLVSRFIVMQLEIDTILDEVVGPNPAPLGPVELLGHGVGHSVGRVGKLRIMDPEGDATERLRQMIGAEKVDAFLSEATLELERSILRGPQDAEMEAKLRASGWQPDAALKVAQKRADAEAAQVVVLDGDPQWRRGRLRDVIAARELMIELMDPFLEGVAARGASISDLFEDRTSSRRFIRSMPSTEVAVEMKTHFHKNRESRWDANTIFDIDAMALSVPYCDAVVTEKHACATLVRAGFEERMDTALMRSPEELEGWLSSIS